MDKHTFKNKHIRVIVEIGTYGICAIMLFILYKNPVPVPSYYITRHANAAAHVDLRNAATAQEAYFYDHQKYADTIEPLLSFTYGLRLGDDVVIDVTYANEKEYIMVSFHPKGDQGYRIKGPSNHIETILKEEAISMIEN